MQNSRSSTSSKTIQTFASATALWFVAVVTGIAGTPPPVTLAYTTPGGAPVQGGVTLGNSGSLFLTTLQTENLTPKLISLSASHTTQWVLDLGMGGQVLAPPSVSPNGTRLYLGNDAGRMLCVDPTTGTLVFNVQLTTSGDRRIRSTPSINMNTAQVGAAGAVYYHANDGWLYGLNASTGATLPGWPVSTGNIGGPPTFGGHTEPWSSSPVIAADGKIYVGSANGRVYGFTPAGVKVLDVSVGAPMEGSLAIANNGWLHGGTRESVDFDQSGIPGTRFAINPALYTQANPAAAIVWSSTEASGPLSFIASPVIDQAGFVYHTDFGHLVKKVHPDTGLELARWQLSGKLCQTPAINQFGQMFIGISYSVPFDQDTIYGSFASIDLASTSEVAEWESVSTGNNNYGEFLGAVLIRATTTGRVYFADTLGRLYFFNSGSPLMAGDWPTFQGGSRRTGVVGQYPFAIAELPSFYGGNNFVLTLGALNVWGEAVGTSYGYYAYPFSSALNYCAARWQNQTLTGYGQTTGIAGSTATSINAAGEASGHFSGGPLVWPPEGGSPLYLSIGPNSPGFTLSSCRAMDINSSGTIIGHGTRTMDGITSVERIVWFRIGMTWDSGFKLPAAAGRADYANAISDTLTIVGRSRFSPTGSFRAAVSFNSNPDPIDLGTFGGLSSEALDVHSASGYVGWANNSTARQRAFFAPEGTTTLQAWHELPRLPGTASTTYNSQARSVNAFGQVVGRIQNDAGSYVAFRYTPGGGSEMRNLNSLPLANNSTPANQGWNLTDTFSINDAGHMVGTGTKSGQARAWMIYPIVIE
jgi:probable HAF family extracellular repeat protein